MKVHPLLRKTKVKLLKQSKPILWLGGVRDMMQRAQSYYGLFNIFISMATLYTVREAAIHRFLPWANFVRILIIMLLGILCLIIIDYKVVYPSQTAFHTHEAFKHRNLMREQLENSRKRQEKSLASIAKSQDEINSKLDDLASKLSEIQNGRR